MKLFVDDIRACPEGWVLARTNTEAIRMLAKGLVEEISLDHDILAHHNGEIYILETFMPIAEYIAIMEKKPKVRFHTGNLIGGRIMAETIGCEFNHVTHCTSWEDFFKI